MVNVAFKLDIDPKEQKHLEKMLAEAPAKLRRKHVRRAVSFAITPVLKAARKLAPRDTGDLKRYLKRKIKSYSKNATIFGMVGPEKHKAPHAHLVEFGHRIVVGGTVARKDGSLKGGGKNRGAGRVVGFVPPRPFLRPAFQQNKENMLRRYRQKLIEGLNKEFKK